jgi:hypothetical protein
MSDTTPPTQVTDRLDALRTHSPVEISRQALEDGLGPAIIPSI